MPIVQATFVTRARWQISCWEAAILQAARSSGCEVVLSEDLSDQRDYQGIRVENPFRQAAWGRVRPQDSASQGEGDPAPPNAVS